MSKEKFPNSLLLNIKPSFFSGSLSFFLIPFTFIILYIELCSKVAVMSLFPETSTLTIILFPFL